MMYLKIDETGQILRASVFNYEDGSLLFDYDEDVLKRPARYKVENNLLILRGDYTEIFEEENFKIPQSITPRQGMLLLSRRGQLAMVEQTIYNLELITGDKQLAEEALIEWNKASSWDRQNKTVQFVADMLMWSEEDKDDFFVEADKLK